MTDLANSGPAAAETEPLIAGTLPGGAFAEVMPQLFLSLLERRYLADFEASRWQVSPAPEDSARPLLREVLALGRPQPGEDWSQAMPHVLTASHAMGQAVVMIVHGDGQQHRVFFGGRRIAAAARGSTQDFLEEQASALRANVTGLRLSEPVRLDGRNLPELAALLQEAPALAVMTGIPAPRGEAGVASPFQSIDRLISAVGTRRYALVVIAEPLDPRDLDQTIDLCRRLQGDVHALVQRSFQESRTEQTSETRTEREGGAGAASKQLDYLSLGLQGVALFCQVAGLFTGYAAFTRPLGVAIEKIAKGRRDGHRDMWEDLSGVVATSAGLARGLWGGGPSGTPVQKGITQSQAHTVTTELLDANARACEDLLQQHIERLQAARSGGWWRAAVYVAAESDAALETVTGALRGICSGRASALDPLRDLRLPPWRVRPAAIQGQVLRLVPAAGEQGHPLGPSYDALATCVSSDELSVLVNLPRRDVPGLTMRDVGEFALSAAGTAEPAVRLGSVQDSFGRALDAVTVTAGALNRHVFVTGMTGYGKTTTAKKILLDSYRTLDVPFLVIEPVKAEYRELAGHPELRGRMTVYAIGGQGPADARRSPAGPVLPFRVNPFMPIESVPLMRHIDLLKAVFNASFPMFAGMSYVLEEAILEVYQERGWDLHTSSNDVLGSSPAEEDLSALVPSIGDLHDKIDQVLERRQYGREVHQNLGAALRSRLRSLMLGAKGMALDARRSIPAEQLFSRPCVIELRNLGDDEEKSFVIALLLCQLYEYAEARHAAAPPRAGEKLAHLTLIEEAHRLLRASRPSSGPETPDAQAKAVTLFTDMLAEMRAYGEGFVVVDQIPTKLAPDVLKNSNIKIIHRLVAPDDRSAVGGTINLTDAQTKHLANLPPGVAVVHDERIGSPVLMQVDQQEPGSAETPGLAAPIGDEQLRARLPDLTYLHRNAGCRYCQAPCDFLHLAEGGALTSWLDTALEPFFGCLLLGSADDAWRLWAEWRSAYQQRRRLDHMPAAAAGVIYCAASQAGHRWLGRTLTARRAAIGVKGWTAEDRLAQDRAARQIGRLCRAWLEDGGLDTPRRAAFTAAQAALRAQVAARPPRELPGCASCPSPCLMLTMVAPVLPEVGEAIASRISAPTAVDTRLRALATVTDPIVGRIEAQIGSPVDRTALLHCLITTSCATSAGAGPSEALAALPRLDAPTTRKAKSDES
jgi:DNA helicase HerA-like ATPase